MATTPVRLRYAARRMMALYVSGALVMIAVAGLAGDKDCRQLADGDVSALADGYHIASKGWTIGYGSDLIKPSLDEHYHLCEGTMYTTSPMTPGGAKSEPFPRCLYAPSPAF